MIRLFSVGLLTAACLLVTAASADAGFGHRRHLDPSCAVEPGCSAFEPACAIEPSCEMEPDCGAVTCCPTNPCIKYRHKHAHKHKHDCGCCPEPTYETVLTPTSPETGCSVNVPVCLPACCQGCPCEASRCTLFGCGQVRYDYACGCSVIVRFQKHGDILVTYVGF
ncbi:MAG: hypothetical protein EBS56_05700 [Planctomycetia bacterium]|nr:hypothetical protein [Planctomycetia bacterium]